MFALLVARRAPDARIFAFEPMPSAYEALRLNAEIHGLQAVTFDCALGSESGKASFTYFPHLTILSGHGVDPSEDATVLRDMLENADGSGARGDLEDLVQDRLEHETIERPVRTVSEVMRQHGVAGIDLLKVDVEGAELDVLGGIEERDWPKIRQVFVEVHGGEERLRGVCDVLEGAGFALTVEQDDALLQVSDRYDVFAVRDQVAPPAPGAAAPTAVWRSARRFEETLRAHLEERLPGYMVPAAITMLDTLPLTRNGKTDRKALPPPTWEVRADEEFMAPRTPIEELIAETWRSVLGVHQVGREDNFFNLGGHSLLAARVTTEVRERCAIELSVRALFEQPTLAAFAAQVESVCRGSRPPAKASPVPAPAVAGDELGAADDRDSAPVSFQQESLLFFDALDPGSVIYNAPLAVRIAGELDQPALGQAIDDLLCRHEALRTVLVHDDSGARQVVLGEWDVELPVIDLTAFAQSERELELERRLQEHARRPFDLGRDVMLRATLFRLGPLGHVLLLQSHHIVLDAWAVEIMCRELGELYDAARAGRAAKLPALAMGYRDFARWQRNRLRGELLDRELDFWRAQLAGAPSVLGLPMDKRRPREQSFEGATHTIRLGAGLATAVRETAQAEQVTPYMLLLAAFATLLYRRSGQDDILFGGPMANREHPGLEHLIGFCANTIVVRTRLAGNPQFRDLLAGVRESVLQSYEHQEVPLELVVDGVRPQRQPGVNPLFQVNFRVRVGAPPVPRLTGANTSLSPVDLHHARFDLALELHVLDDGIAAAFNYNTALFESATIERLAEDFEHLLGQALAEPETRLLSFEVGAEPVAGPQNGSAPDRLRPAGIRRFRQGSGSPR
jgi:FkbM family methyltransferase